MNTTKTLTAIAAIGAFSLLAGCSKKTRTTDILTPAPYHASVKTVAMKKLEPVVAPPIGKASEAPTKRNSSQPLAFRSRDYGVSFQYPWQYTLRGARAMDNDASLRPASDGHEGQFTLARVDIPKGFYPGTDFDSGYLALSLNQDLDELQCGGSLGQGKVSNVTINGVDFHMMETESGGRGSASMVRNYVAFVNGACYEIEEGVKTRNDGRAREIDPGQVMRRLDAILNSVVINPAMKPADDVAQKADPTQK